MAGGFASELPAELSELPAEQKPLFWCVVCHSQRGFITEYLP